MVTTAELNPFYQSLDSKTDPQGIPGDGRWHALRFTDATPTGPEWPGPVKRLTRLPIIADGRTDFDLALFSDLDRLGVSRRKMTRPWIRWIRIGRGTRDQTHVHRIDPGDASDDLFGHIESFFMQCRIGTPIAIEIKHESRHSFVIEQAMIKWDPKAG